MNVLKKADSKLAKLIRGETKRQQETLDLIPSENITSTAPTTIWMGTVVGAYRNVLFDLRVVEHFGIICSCAKTNLLK